MKLAVITGGSKGLGQALVALFSKNDWRVVEFSRSGNISQSVSCDFSQPEQAAQTLNSQFETLSQTDWEEVVVINNVGTLNPIGKIHTKDHADWISSININFSSAVLVSGLFLKHFQTHAMPKCIVNISSGAAKKTYEGWSLYCSTKSAMESFSRCVALEQAAISNGANSIIINPGVMDTEMQQKIRSTSDADFPTVERFHKLKEEGDLQSSERVAEAIYTIVGSKLEQGGSYDVADYFQ